MAKVNVKAPVGYHFMVKDDGAFYVMKTSGTYAVHTAGEYTSQLSVAMDVRDTHTVTPTQQTTASSTRTTSTRRTTTPRRTTTSTRSTGSTGSGGGGGY